MNPATDRATVAIGFVGTKLDVGGRGDRWSSWRPTVALCQHEDLVIDRLELLYTSRRDEQLVHQIREDLAGVSPETEVRPHELAIGDPWDFETVYRAIHGFARETEWRTDDEDYLVHIATGTHVIQICLFLMTESRHLPARLIQTSPPLRGDPLPGRFTIIDLDLGRYDEIAQRFAIEHAEAVDVLKSGIPTRNAAFNRQIEEIEKVALVSTASILIMGPTGAGKSLLARRIFELKNRRHHLTGPFVAVNCATLRGDIAMSTLFGHRKGAFTGAVSDRAGLLCSADGGVLFLDEIGELGPDEQAMLLGALEEGRFLPVGSDREVLSEFQLIAGTNRDLHRDVAAGRFREDLLARIDLWTFRLPGLRERIEDVEPNLDYELDLHTGTSGRRVTFNKEARTRYLAFATSAEAEWRGNFRDLNASVTRMATLARGGRIDREVVEAELVRLRRGWSASRDDGTVELERVLGEKRSQELDRFDRAQLIDVIGVCRGAASLSEAGRLLFQVSRERRKTANDADRLRKYLARFGLKFADFAD